MTANLAMKQALEFINQHSKYWNGSGEHPQEIATNLKDSIKQMEQVEPVAIVDDAGTIIVCSYDYKPGDELYCHPRQNSAPVYQWRDTRSNNVTWKDAPARWYDEWRAYPYYEWRILYAYPAGELLSNARKPATVDVLGNQCESECVACVGCSS